MTKGWNVGRRTRLEDKQSRPGEAEVVTRQLSNPETIALALQKAGNDRRRFRYNDDGSITVLNNPQ